MRDHILKNPITLMRLKRTTAQPKALISDVEKELSENVLLIQDHLAITPKYLVEFRLFSTVIIPLESVLWVFHLQSWNFSLKDFRSRMFFALRITTISGAVFYLRDYSRKDLDRILELLTDRYPNFFYDYSEEHEKMVNYILVENKKELKAKRASGRR